MSAERPLVAVLGAGQLGRMLGLAAIRMGVRCRFLDPAAASAEGCPASAVGEVIAAEFTDRPALDRLADGADAATYEFENVPDEAVDYLGKRVVVSPPGLALRTAQDRLLEKKAFEACEIPTNRTVAWEPIAGARIDTAMALQHAVLGMGLGGAVLKTRRMGYDGKGQEVVGPANRDAFLHRIMVKGDMPTVPMLVEEFVRFSRELSIVAARGRDGEMRFWPLVENTHKQGILRRTVAPAPGVSAELQARAEGYVRTLMDRLRYVGVMALELFETEKGLLANEIAPRVHNTGHWTIEGARTSQFENHVRAVLGWPLGDSSAVGHSVMLNLIGQDVDRERVMRVAGASLHWYGKSIRPGRKVGHVTVCAGTAEEAGERAGEVERIIGVV